MKKKVLIEFSVPGNGLINIFNAGLWLKELKWFECKHKYFDKIYFISFRRDEIKIINKLPPYIKILYNKWNLPGIIYAILMPFLFYKEIKEANLFFTRQLSCSLYAIYCKLIFNKPVVVRCGYDWEYFVNYSSTSFLYKMFVKFWCWLTYKFSDKLYVTSQRHLKKVHKIRKKNDTNLIPNFADDNVFFKTNCKRENFILAVGRLEKQKNFHNLISAMKNINNHILYICGEGSLKNDLINLANNLKVQVKFLGNVQHHTLNLLFNRCTLFVHPTLYEGCSNIIIEAMMAGTPILAADIPENCELIDNNINGLISKTDVINLNNNIKKLINDRKKINDLSVNAREKAINNYSNKIYCNKLLTIFKTLLDN